MAARHFHGIVSRFSAGRKEYLPPADRQAATSLLQRSGVSSPGIRQFLAGEAVANAVDRYRLAGIVGELMDPQQAPQVPVPYLVMVPPVPSAPEVGRRVQKLQDFGLSALGAQEFVAGLPINGADDRLTLPQLVIAALHGALPVHGRGYNEMTLDDTSGKEK